MTTFVYGTGNPAKLKSMQECLASLNINVIGLNDIGVYLLDVKGSGNTPLENARIKALSYYNAIKRPVFCLRFGIVYRRIIRL